VKKIRSAGPVPRVVFRTNAPGAVEPPSEPALPSRLEPGGGFGSNNLRRLASYVYFIRAESRELSAVSCRKVVVTR
jgi:hypothetical protein